MKVFEDGKITATGCGKTTVTATSTNGVSDINFYIRKNIKWKILFRVITAKLLTNNMFGDILTAYGGVYI